MKQCVSVSTFSVNKTEYKLEPYNRLRPLLYPSFFHARCCIPIPVAVRYKAWVCGRSLTGIAGSNPTGGHGCLSVVSVVCCQVEVSATGWSLVRRSPTECGVSQMCVIVKPQKMRRPRPPRGCRAIGKKKIYMRYVWSKLFYPSSSPTQNISYFTGNIISILLIISFGFFTPKRSDLLWGPLSLLFNAYLFFSL
jgi:hypothetical protein